jgi:hypothetical protein
MKPFTQLVPENQRYKSLPKFCLTSWPNNRWRQWIHRIRVPLPKASARGPNFWVQVPSCACVAFPALVAFPEDSLFLIVGLQFNLLIVWWGSPMPGSRPDPSWGWGVTRLSGPYARHAWPHSQICRSHRVDFKSEGYSLLIISPQSFIDWNVAALSWMILDWTLKLQLVYFG